MSIHFSSRCLLATAFVLTASPQLWAQVGLQITIGSYGRAYGGFYGSPPFGVGPVGPGPYGVGPSLSFYPRGRAIFAAPYYSGYRGYNVYIPAPDISVYGRSPYARPQSPMDYPHSGIGPYSGTHGNTMNNSLNYDDKHVGNNYYQSQSAIRPQSTYASGAAILSPDTPDLRPGMVLPDGSTVISVGKPGEKSGAKTPPTPPTAQGADKLPIPPPLKPLPAKSGRTAF